MCVRFLLFLPSRLFFRKSKETLNPFHRIPPFVLSGIPSLHRLDQDSPKNSTSSQDARSREERLHVDPLLLHAEADPPEEAKSDSFLKGSDAPHSGHAPIIYSPSIPTPAISAPHSGQRPF